jgi:hypothetical protein
MLADKRYCYALTIPDFASRYLISCETRANTQALRPGESQPAQLHVGASSRDLRLTLRVPGERRDGTGQ